MGLARLTIRECLGCGAVSAEDGKALPHECSCETAGWRVRPVGAECLDPKTGAQPDYATLVISRMVADEAYLVLVPLVGHAEAAREVCSRFGHDSPRGLCDRCGLGTESVGAEDRGADHRSLLAKRDAWLRTRQSQ